jgi:subtilase family serine protease
MLASQVSFKLRLLSHALLLIPTLTSAQSSDLEPTQTIKVPQRITQAVDEAQRTVLHGNTHLLARPEFDRGAAPPNLPLNRMLLVLKRSPEQESVLQQLLIELHDSMSPTYHKWLSPEQFGQQFGPADQDVQVIVSWLESHGFEIVNVTKGRSIIEFSGTAAQAQEAFQTEIHKFVVNDEEHWANASDPQIPVALAPVVLGPATLHNFRKHPNIVMSNVKSATGKLVPGSRPQITFTGGNHGVGPADFAKIYNVPNMLNPTHSGQEFDGNGITIAVIGRSNINVTDISDFRSLFGLPGNFSSSNIILNGPDPGNLGQIEEVEAVLDVSWAGAAAPAATVELVVSESTETTDGTDLSEVYIVDNNLANVMTESFGFCEQTGINAFFAAENSLAEQAAAQGITFMASSGDSGAVCGTPASPNQVATQIPASLQFTVAIGGTMITANDSAFWNATNAQGTFESAKSYIPEDVWNESAQSPAASGGGVSTIFSKPVWQTGVPNIPNDGKRDVPDVSLNAAANHDPVVICVADIQSQQGGLTCEPNAQGQFSVMPIGGTSVAAPSFASIMALVNQSQQARQGEAGFVLYKLAASEASNPTLTQCNASTGSGPTSTGCVFNDVTSGNNIVPGENGTSFQSGVGYDLATGLGSVNVTNLITNWSTAGSKASTGALTLTPSFPNTSTHGQSVSVAITVAASQLGAGTPTGDVSLLANTGPSGARQAIQSFTLDATGKVSANTNLLPGGVYNITAHYEGDGTFLPSDSPPVDVNVSQESSNTQVELVFVDPTTFQITNDVKSVTFGSNYLLRVNVSGASGICAQNTLGQEGCPTGTAAVTANTNPVDAGTFKLNSLGHTEDQTINLAPGSYALQAVYSGDSSYKGSTSPTDNAMVTKGPTTLAVSPSTSNIFSGDTVTLTATISTQSFTTAPSGSVTFMLGNTQLGSGGLMRSANTQTGFVQAIASFTTTANQLPSGADTIAANYAGDTNYTGSTGSTTVNVGGAPGFNIALSPLPINISAPGASGQATLTVTAVNGFNGTISLSASVCSGLPSESSCNFSLPSITGSGSATLTIATMAPSLVAPTRGPNGYDQWGPFGKIVVACFLCVAILLLRLQPRRRLSTVIGLMLIAGLLAIGACGGGVGGGGGHNPGTPVGQDINAKIALTSGSTTNSITFAINVQ